MTGYGKFSDPYCYKGSPVLLNRQGIASADELEAFEVAMFTLRYRQVLPEGLYDPAHYRAIHRHLFQDVYEWAGEYRTIRIAKGNAMFCYPEHISEQMELLFISLQKSAFHVGATEGEFVIAAANFLADLNAIHPFREGNGRTQLTFLFLLGERAGVSLDMTQIRPKEILTAMIASFDGKLEALEDEIGRLVV